jgi:hypothetical protein
MHAFLKLKEDGESSQSEAGSDESGQNVSMDVWRRS